MTAAVFPASPGRARRLVPLALASGLLLLAVAVVDPFREFLGQDDAWAYARMVEHWLATGRYRIDAWSAADLPMHVAVGGVASSIAGYSFTTLRVTTLLLLGVAMASLFSLAQAVGAPRRVATGLAIGLAASPLVLLLAFTFMSDVPFVAWMLLALAGWSRGLVSGRAWPILLGSLAAAAAIGTRQFGIALVAGPVAAALFASPRIGWRTLALAIAAPAIVAGLQLAAGWSTPNFTQAARLLEQAHHASLPWATQAGEVAWRLAALTEYVGLSLLPVAPLIAALAWRRGRNIRRNAGLAVTWLGATGLVGAGIASLVLLGDPSTLTARESTRHVLPLQWMLPNVLWADGHLRRALAGFGLLTGIGWLWIAAPAVAATIRRRTPLACLLAASGLALLALHLGYVQMHDTYVVGLLPFALLAVGRAARVDGVPRGATTATVAVAATSLLALAIVMRGEANRHEAQWFEAERQLARGGPARCVGGGRHWSEYHGAFDDWLAAGHPGYEPPRDGRSPNAPPPLHPPFYAWLESRAASGRVRVLEKPDETVPPGWRTIGEAPYRDRLLRPRRLLVLGRVEGTVADDVACR